MPQEGELNKYLAGPIDDSQEGEKLRLLSHKVDNLKAIFGKKLLDASSSSEDEGLEALEHQADQLRSESQQFEKHTKKAATPPEKSNSGRSWMCLFTCCLGRDTNDEPNVGVLDEQLAADYPYWQIK